MNYKVEYTIAWDGEPSMSGLPRRNSTGIFSTFADADRALKMYPSAKTHPERNYRIEVRMVGEWSLL